MSTTTSPSASTGSRWPTTITVAPAAARRAIACSALFSVTSSRCAVGSSKQQDPRRGAEHACESEPLPLAQRQTHSALPDPGVQPVGQPGQHLVETRRPARIRQVGQRTEQFEVLPHGAGDEHGALRQPGHLGPPGLRVEIGDVDPVHPDLSGFGRRETENGLQQRRFPDAVGSGEHRDPTGLGRQLRRVDLHGQRRIRHPSGARGRRGGGVDEAEGRAARRSYRPVRSGTRRRPGAAARTPRARAAAR